MDAVAAFLGGDATGDRHTDKCKIADDVEYLVADKFVSKPQGRFVEHPAVGQHNRVVERAAKRDLPSAACRSRVNPNVRADAICLPNEPSSKTNYTFGG